MTSPTERILRGFVLLAAVIAFSTMGYRYGFGLGWLEATWMTVITVTGTGFAEESRKPPAFQLFTIASHPVWIHCACLFADWVGAIAAGRRNRTLVRKTQDGASTSTNLQNHVIVCGYGRLGHSLISDLAAENQPLLIIESDPQKGSNGGKLMAIWSWKEMQRKKTFCWLPDWKEPSHW